MYLQITKYIRSHHYKNNVWNGLTTLRQTILCASNISGTTSHQCRCNTLEPCNGKMVPWGIGCKTDPPFQLLSLHTMPANLIIMHTEIGDKGGVGGWNENANGREGQCLISVFWAVTDAQLQTNKQKQKQLLVSNNEKWDYLFYCHQTGKECHQTLDISEATTLQPSSLSMTTS